jgi:hypothetical protein
MNVHQIYRECDWIAQCWAWAAAPQGLERIAKEFFVIPQVHELELLPSHRKNAGILTTSSKWNGHNKLLRVVARAPFGRSTSSFLPFFTVILSKLA